MLGKLALYAANRAAGGAVESMTRWASWGAVAALFGLCAFVFAVIALYTKISLLYGDINAATMIAGGALVVALLCVAAPQLLDYLERKDAERARAKEGVITSTVNAASQETAAAVDYFGPLQVVVSAFLVGMRTGHQVRGIRRQ